MDEAPLEVRDSQDPSARWFAAPEFASVLEHSILPHRARLEDAEFARSVKRNQNRHVVYLEIEGHAIYAKIHRFLDPAKRLVERFVGDRAKKEWRTTHALRALGLHVPEPLAYGESRTQPLRSYYLCRAIAPARTLTATLADPDLRVDERSSLLEVIARDLATMHAARIHHRDFHGNNVLVHASGVPHVIDLHSPWHVFWLPPRWRRLPLAKFLASLRDALSEEDVDHFLAAYENAWGRETTSGRRQAFARRVRLDAEAIYREHRDSRIARCLAKATLFTRRRTPARRLYSRRELPVERIAALMDRAERGEGTLLKAAPRTRVVKLEDEGHSFVVKTFLFEGPKGLFRYVFSRSRAERAWIAARALEVIGLETPRAHACSSRLLGGDHVLTEFAPHEGTLEDFVPARWQHLEREERRLFCARLGAALARLHANDAHHQDLSAKNVLVVRNEEGLVPWFVDLEAVRLGKPLRDEDRVRAFGQLNDVPRQRVSRSERLRVLRSYEHALHETFDRSLTARIDAWTRARVERRESRWRAEGREVAESSYYGRTK